MRRAAPLDRSSASLPSGPRLHARIFLWIGAAVTAWGTLRALHFSWVCDDAYLSFRYARNLTRGMGLVFNAGERVEGYTNFLWTLWCALGLRLGVTPETWSVLWGVACFTASLMLLCVFTLWRRRETGSFLLPVAAMLAASHRDWAIYATSGLEASLLCLLAVGGYLLLVLRPLAPARAAAAGAELGLASLTRPDGILFAALGGLFVLWTARPRWRVALAYAIPFLAVWLPWMMWKLGYYGDVFPNTYYAKSAYLPWYEQGLVYLGLYFMKYGVLASGLMGRGAGGARSRGERGIVLEQPREPSASFGACLRARAKQPRNETEDPPVIGRGRRHLSELREPGARTPASHRDAELAQRLVERGLHVGRLLALADHQRARHAELAGRERLRHRAGNHHARAGHAAARDHGLAPGARRRSASRR